MGAFENNYFEFCGESHEKQTRKDKPLLQCSMGGILHDYHMEFLLTAI